MEVELIRQAREGDQDALVQAIMCRKEEYYRLAYLYTGNEADALDAVADMIVILLENIRRLKNPESFDSWSKTILVNRCKKMKRRGRKVVPVERLEETPYIEKYENRDAASDLLDQLERLNPRQKEAIRLRYFLDLDYKSIAKILAVPVGTVKSRVSIGLKKLKERLGGEYR